MRVSEIFRSLQGEGIHAGTPTTFIRLQGCNLRCRWCDTAYAQDPNGGNDLTVSTIVEEVKRLSSDGLVCITGGEPLIHLDFFELVNKLRYAGYRIHVETNGTIPISPKAHYSIHSWVVDYKLPSSGEDGKHVVDWRSLYVGDQVKFVALTIPDLDDIKRVVLDYRSRVSSHSLGPILLVSPVTQGYCNELWLQRVAEFCVGYDLRLSLQLHKIIWGNRKGV